MTWWIKEATEIRWGPGGVKTFNQYEGAYTPWQTLDLLPQRPPKAADSTGSGKSVRVGLLLNDASAARQMALLKKTGATVRTVQAGNICLNYYLSEQKKTKCIGVKSDFKSGTFCPKITHLCS